MGVLVNAVKDVGAGLDTNSQLQLMSKSDGIKQLGRSSNLNLDAGSKACLIASECRDVAKSVALTDFKKASISGGMVAFYAMSLGGTNCNANLKVGFS